MSRKHDFYVVAGLAILIAYANLIGPHRLIDQLFPNGTFIVTALARTWTSPMPPVAARTPAPETAKPAAHRPVNLPAPLLKGPKPAAQPVR